MLGLLPDHQIISLAERGMIAPFRRSLVRIVNVHSHGDLPPITRKVISYGLSSYGYDLCLSPADFKVFRHIPGTVVDPKNFNPENLYPLTLHKDIQGEFFVLPAHSYGLGVIQEKLELPEDISALFIGKSTYARAGIICNLTPGEAGWKGHLTVEISNSSSADCRIYANEGICQALFLRSTKCEISYSDRNGKYQDQPQQVVTAKV